MPTLNNYLKLNPFHIETKRLLIRNLTPSDHTAYFQIFGNPNIALYDDYIPISEEESVRNIDEIRTNYLNGNPEQEFAVALKQDNKTVGILYMNNESNHILVGYHFNENHQRKGYAIEAVEAFIEWIRNHFEKKIKALVDYQNLPSIRVLEKLGFELQQKNGDELVYELPYNKTESN